MCCGEGAVGPDELDDEQPVGLGEADAGTRPLRAEKELGGDQANLAGIAGGEPGDGVRGKRTHGNTQLLESGLADGRKALWMQYGHDAPALQTRSRACGGCFA